MAHFAKISNSNVVVQVLVVPDDQEHRGQEYLANDLNLGGRWIQTSYNTIAGEHVLGGLPLRKNFAGIGMVYDEEKDAFYQPICPGSSWVFDEEKCIWVNTAIEPDLNEEDDEPPPHLR